MVSGILENGRLNKTQLLLLLAVAPAALCNRETGRGMVHAVVCKRVVRALVR